MLEAVKIILQALASILEKEAKERFPPESASNEETEENEESDEGGE